jgi:hypothetical protein
MLNNSGFKAIALVAVRSEFIWSIFRNNSVSELAQRLWFFRSGLLPLFNQGNSILRANMVIESTQPI